MEDIDLRINDSLTPIEHHVLEYDSAPEWWGIVFEHDYWVRDFIICNVTFFENTHTVLSLSFSTSFRMLRGHIHYDIGTSRAWLTRINETVEFRITGEQPESQSEECEIYSINNGFAYVWNWEDEYIEPYSVGVYFDIRNWFQKIGPGKRFLIYFIGISVLIFIIIPLTVKNILEIRRKRKHN